MAVSGWILDKSASSRWRDPQVAEQLRELAGQLLRCPVSRLEELYSATSGGDYERRLLRLDESVPLVDAPEDVFDRVLALQRDLAHHHGLWHRVPIPDLLIAETALHHGLGVVHVDGDFDRIAEVRPLRSRRLRTSG